MNQYLREKQSHMYGRSWFNELAWSTLMVHRLSCFCTLYPVNHCAVCRAPRAPLALAALTIYEQKVPHSTATTYAVLYSHAWRCFDPLRSTVFALDALPSFSSQFREVAISTVAADRVVSAPTWRCDTLALLTGLAW